jgi:ribosomal subunit interface protein
MEITLATRHCTVPEPILRHAEERLTRLTKFEPRAASVSVAFQQDHGEKQVETRVAVRGAGVLAAHGAGESFREALDRSAARLERQLRRRRDRLVKRRIATAATEPPDPGAAP